jgi:hypothetical protein
MAKASEHGNIIAAAAKAALAPIGCVRKGQSRVWYSDQRYWLIAVEFQPSGWSKGSYLNIFITWLWKETQGYAISYRPAGFVPFENTEQFAAEIANMAAVAAREVEKQRERFSTFDRLYQHLLSESDRDSWPKYNAAVAAGLRGEMKIARRLFGEMEAWTTYGSEWQEKLKADSAALARLLDEPAQFRAAVLAIIERRREIMRLAPDPHCLDALDSIRSS